MSDGYFTVSGLLKVCKDTGYDVVAITDHAFDFSPESLRSAVTVPHPLQLRGVEDILIIRGIEITMSRLHLICLEPSVFNRRILGLIESSRVSWIAHPGLNMLNVLACQKICEELNLDGVELYNSGIRQLKGYFDGNLYAVDDLHIPSQLSTSWIEMDVKRLDKENVLGKLKSGDFVLRWKPLDVLFF